MPRRKKCAAVAVVLALSRVQLRVEAGEGGKDCFTEASMVLPDRIELSTSPLPRECSTTELRQRAPAKTSRKSRPETGRSLPHGGGGRKRGRLAKPRQMLLRGCGGILPRGEFQQHLLDPFGRKVLLRECEPAVEVLLVAGDQA